MLSTILSALKGIWEGILTAFEFVIGLIEDLVYIVKLLGENVSKIPDYVSWLPTPLLVVIPIIFAIVVIYKISGREG